MTDKDAHQIESEGHITSEVKGISTVITINRPEALNALNFYHYWALEEAVKNAAANPDTRVTIIQGSGKYFSAGADVQSASVSLTRTDKGETDFEARRELTGAFSGRNAVFTDTLWNHPKVLIVALNGPVVGLSVAVPALADFVFARDSAFLLTPFANLSLVSEGATSFALPQRLGISLANKALLAAEPVSADELYRVGFVNKLYSRQLSTDDFNQEVLNYANHRFSDLDPESLLKIKQLVHSQYNSDFEEASAREIIGGLDRFSRGLPQHRFAEMATKTRRHKL